MKNSYKIWMVISFILAFTAGILGGVLLERNILDAEKKRDRGRRPPFPTLEVMAQTLELSDEQQEEIRQIFSRNEIRLKQLQREIHRRFSSFRVRILRDIKQVLDEEQKNRFDKMIEDYRKKRRKEWESRREKDKDRDKPPGNF